MSAAFNFVKIFSEVSEHQPQVVSFFLPRLSKKLGLEAFSLSS